MKNLLSKPECAECIKVDPDRDEIGMFVVRALNCVEKIIFKFDAKSNDIIVITGKQCTGRVNIGELFLLSSQWQALEMEPKND